MRAAQKRPVGVEAHLFGWGKHRVRLYAARTRRGVAPAPRPLRGEKVQYRKRRATQNLRRSKQERNSLGQNHPR